MINVNFQHIQILKAVPKLKTIRWHLANLAWTRLRRTTPWMAAIRGCRRWLSSAWSFSRRGRARRDPVLYKWRRFLSPRWTNWSNKCPPNGPIPDIEGTEGHQSPCTRQLCDWDHGICGKTGKLIDYYSNRFWSLSGSNSRGHVIGSHFVESFGGGDGQSQLSWYITVLSTLYR